MSPSSLRTLGTPMSFANSPSIGSDYGADDTVLSVGEAEAVPMRKFQPSISMPNSIDTASIASKLPARALKRTEKFTIEHPAQESETDTADESSSPLLQPVQKITVPHRVESNGNDSSGELDDNISTLASPNDGSCLSVDQYDHDSIYTDRTDLLSSAPPSVVCSETGVVLSNSHGNLEVYNRQRKAENRISTSSHMQRTVRCGTDMTLRIARDADDVIMGRGAFA